MVKKLFVLLAASLFLIFLNRTRVLWQLRSSLEKRTVLSLYRPDASLQTVSQPLHILSLEEEIRKLKSENKTLRRQLGAIPERSNLLPAHIIWEESNQYTLELPYPVNKDLKGHPVVWGDIYLGRIARLGENIVLVTKPTSSGFSAVGETQTRVKGILKGEFNEQIIFEASVNSSLSVNDTVYLLDKEHAWRFVVGRVTSVSRDKRLPVKQAVIDYLPQKSKLSTVFVVE